MRPLAEAVNLHMHKTQELTAQQRMFLDDASHQLRTHLTTLRMQVDFASGPHVGCPLAGGLPAGTSVHVPRLFGRLHARHVSVLQS